MLCFHKFHILGIAVIAEGAETWLLAPERNTDRFSPGFEFGKGRILQVLNDRLKGNAEQGAPPDSAEPRR
jgi:hypothetical protein